ncbi:rod shape-determining protein MreC [Lutibacter sp. B2]|nr:rod shape-determining protein MreC [Lutibacter sp. B2]
MIVTIVTIILIIMIGISAGGRTRVSTSENMVSKVTLPVQKFFYRSGKSVNEFAESLFAFKRIEKENKKLQKQIEELNTRCIEESLTRDELDELRSLYKILNYQKFNNEYKYIAASVVAKNPGNWFNIFTIDAGEKEGVLKDSTVMNGQGLIGKVFEVGNHWSKAISIIDNKSSVSSEVLRNNQYMGIVRGSINSEITGLIDPEAEVLVGDKLITSGLSNYAKGILIGEIKEVIKKEDELLKTIVVKPAVDFKKLDKVFIIMPNEYK